MENFDYEKTFELMKAYAELGVKERKIMEYLFTMPYFEGTYSQLAKQINMDANNLRNTLLYLDALGIVYIKYKKSISELEFKTNCNGKIITSVNKMKACFIVAGWMETLVKRYHDGKIYHEENKKKKFVDEMTELDFKDNDLEYKKTS